MLLPLIGAGIGGYQAYQQSQGNLGATLLGAGLGAAAPGALRMAGTALGGTALGSSALSGLSGLGTKAMQSGLGAQVAKMGVKLPAGPIAPLTAAGVGAAAAGLGTMGLAGLAGRASAAAAPVARTLTGGAAQVMPQGQVPSGYPGGPAVPTMTQFGDNQMYGSDPYSILNPTGAFQAGLLAQDKQSQQSLRNLQRISNYEATMLEGAKKADLQRQLAAAGVRQNIATQAALLQGGVGAAQQMAQTAMGDIGRGLTQTYQYQ